MSLACNEQQSEKFNTLERFLSVDPSLAEEQIFHSAKIISQTSHVTM